MSFRERSFLLKREVDLTDDPEVANNDNSKISRRSFIATISGLIGSALVGATRGGGRLGVGVPLVAPPTWLRDAHDVIRRLKAPRFGTQKTYLQPVHLDARLLIQSTIDRISESEGGRVVLSPGIWRVAGPLILRDRVELHIEDGATVIFSGNRADYLPLVRTRWEGTDLFGYSPCVYAFQVNDVGITGSGTLMMEGGGDIQHWRLEQTKAQKKLRQMGASAAALGDRVFGEGSFLRPAFIQFFDCQRVLVEGVKIGANPFWGIHLVYSAHVVVRGVKIDSDFVNNDGVDVDSSRFILIERCVFQTGDDCIAIKSGRDLDGRQVNRPSEHVVIRDCLMRRGKSAGLAIGSEMSGGIRSIYLFRCQMDEVETVINIKSNLDRGGFVEKVRVWNVSVRECSRLVQLTTSYHGYMGGNFPPRIEDVQIDDLRCQKAKEGISIRGAEKSPIRKVTISHVELAQVEAPLALRNSEAIELNSVQMNGRVVTGVPS